MSTCAPRTAAFTSSTTRNDHDNNNNNNNNNIIIIIIIVIVMMDIDIFLVASLAYIAQTQWDVFVLLLLSFLLFLLWFLLWLWLLVSIFASTPCPHRPDVVISIIIIIIMMKIIIIDNDACLVHSLAHIAQTLWDCLYDYDCDYDYDYKNS